MGIRSRPWLWFGIPALVLLLHTGILAVPAWRLAGSDSVLLFCVLLACAACFWRAVRFGRSRVALQWYLAATGLALWAAGQAIFTYVNVHNLGQDVSLNSEFCYFLYGVPFLLAICSVVDQPRLRSLLIMDLVQAVVVVWLVQVELFSSGRGMASISTAHVHFGYNVENLLLAGAAGLCLLTGARGAKRQFYRATFCFLVVYAAVAIPVNILSEYYHLQVGSRMDLLWDVPFLLLAALAAWMPVIEEQPSAPASRRFQRVILHSTPVLITAVVLVMGTVLVLYNFWAGLLAVLIGLGSYSLRNSLLEMRYIKTQRKLRESEAALQTAMERFQELSYIDPLTKVPNRRQFEEALETEWNRAMRRGAPLSLFIVDLDHFKLLNDTYGHLRGDDCLILVAQTLSSQLKRAGEMLARYGGEEFAAILPDVPSEVAVQVAESLRAAVADLNIKKTESPHDGQLTISVGVATCYPGLGFTMETLLALADESLYAAKQAGRNRVVSTHDSGVHKTVAVYPERIQPAPARPYVARRP